MEPCRPRWNNVVEADWKNVMDNYLECYHCPIGHPGLSCLMEAEYENLPDDAYYYFMLAHHTVASGNVSIDGVHVTNGFHPLWYLLLVPIFGWGPGLGPGHVRSLR